jgi:hypothetical protein
MQENLQMMHEPIEISTFAKELFLTPSIFFKRYFNPFSKPPFFSIALLIFGWDME